VTCLAEGLEREGVQIFLQERDIGPGQIKLQRIEEAIGTAGTAILVLSAMAMADPKLYDEYAALLREATERELRLIPVLHGSASIRVPPLAGTRLWADFRDLSSVEYDAKVAALATVIRGVGPLVKPRTDGGRVVPVEVLEAARSAQSRPPSPPPRPEFVVTAPPPRLLVAQMPTRVPQFADVSLILRVATRETAFPEAVTTELSGLRIDDDGARVTVVVQAQHGLFPLGKLEQTLWVPPVGDSSPVRFTFQARAVGLQRVHVTAWAGGTFLAELAVEVSVDVDAPYVDGPPRGVPVGPVRAEPGEVTLQVRCDDDRYTFQLLSEPYLFEPVLAEALTAQPTQAVERAIATLRSTAAGRSEYTGDNARRWLQQTGVGLWNDMVPDVIKEQFWQLRSSIASFTIASGRDAIPWELLYPLSPTSDEGFLVEQFPVLRRVYGQQRFREVAAGSAHYVMPPGSPANARDEIAAIRRILGVTDSGPSVISDLGVLLDLIDAGDLGLMHFACHNTFKIDGGGSAITMSGGPFIPALLNTAVTRRTLV
jgi:hypothetical protein